MKVQVLQIFMLDEPGICCVGYENESLRKAKKLLKKEE